MTSHSSREPGSPARGPVRAVARRAPRLGAAVLLLMLPLLVVAPDRALATPQPGSVTVAGSFQSELGCPGDWLPDCPVTQLGYDAQDDVWQGSFSLPAGQWEYKAALNGGWAENYGAHAVADGANIALSLTVPTTVTFYYDHTSHWVTDNQTSVIATAPGSYQASLGCAGDWDPSCLRSWLQDADGDGIYQFTTTAIPAGSYETKVAIDESWAENYGAGGVPNGANIGFTVPPNATMLFSYDAASHILTVSAVAATPIATVTSITSDAPDPSSVGQAVTVGYTVVPTSGGGTPTGSVTVSDGTDSCTGTVAAGACTITLSSAGVRALTASYTGDGAFSGSTSAAQPHVVNVPNTAPTATVANGQCSTNNTASGVLAVRLFDPDGDPLTLALVSDSNPALLPIAGIVLGGSGVDRTVAVTVAAKKKGSATLTLGLSDGTVTVPVVITVIVGSDKNEILAGTDGVDMLFGLGGQNAVNGNAGNDLLCGGNSSDTLNGAAGDDIIDGGNGNDTLAGANGDDILRGGSGDDVLTGGAGADHFSGAAGTDTVTDLDTAQGDTRDSTIP